MAYFRSVSDNEEEEEDDEYLRDRMDRNYPFRDYSHGINPVLQEANYFPESSGAIKQDVDYFQNLLDKIDPHQYISVGILLAVRVGDVLTLKEKDTNTIRQLLMKAVHRLAISAET